MGKNFKIGGSPLQARQNFPIILSIIIVAIIIGFLFCLWILSKKIREYRKSGKYLNRVKNRPSKYSDVVTFAKNNELPQEYISLLWKVISITKSPNINYLFKNNIDVLNLFKNAYEKFSDIGINDKDLFHIFQLQYKLELIVSKSKNLLSTRSLTLSTVVLFLTDDGEQLPFFLTSNTENGFYLEIPEYLYNSSRRPKCYIRQRFIVKTGEGTSFNFVSRIIRYEKNNDNQYFMIVAHTDKIISEAQRHFKREYLDSACYIIPMRPNKTKPEKKNTFIFSSNKYKAKITNISAGGCCIQTDLPIKENQYLCIILEELGISEKIIGIIKRTRRVSTGNYALHIQFVKISLKAKNDILRKIYKYEL